MRVITGYASNVGLGNVGSWVVGRVLSQSGYPLLSPRFISGEVLDMTHCQDEFMRNKDGERVQLMLLHSFVVAYFSACQEFHVLCHKVMRVGKAKTVLLLFLLQSFM